LYELYAMEEVTVFETTLKMLAKNYFADIWNMFWELMIGKVSTP